MNILHLNTNLHGGAAKACLRLHQAQINLGLNSKVLSLMGDEQNERLVGLWDHLNPLIKKAKVFQHRIKNRFAKIDNAGTSFYPLRGYSGWYDLSHHPEVQQADLIHLHWVAEFLDFPRFFRNIPKPIVWTMHDEWPFSGGFHYTSGTNLDHHKDFIDQQEKILAEAYKNNNINWIGPSNWICQQAKKKAWITGPKVNQIVNPLDSNQFHWKEQNQSKTEKDWDADAFQFLFVSAYLDNPAKGFDLALDAFKQLRKTKPNAQLKVVGHPLESNQKEEGLEFLGFVADENELASYYQAADALLFASRIDNYPNTIIEAQACGCPVIGFQTGGIPEMIQAEKNGLLAEKMDSNHLAEAMKKAIDLHWDRKAISKCILLDHDPDTIAKEVQGIYEKAMRIKS